LVENIHEFKFKNISIILNIFKKVTFPIYVAKVPEVISTMSRRFILDTKKEGVYVYFSRFFKFALLNFKKLQDK
jgi:hypothetical protein